MSVLSVFASGGLLSLLVFAALGAGAGALILGGRRGALIGAVLGAIVITVALLPSEVFRAQMGESVVAVFWLSIFLFPIVLYALVLREARKKARGKEAETALPEPGLRLIEQDDALFAEQLGKLLALNDKAPHFSRETFSLAWRDERGEVVGALRVGITMGLAEIRVLHVDEAMRGHGIGAALLTGAEEEARRRGCHIASLYTFSWQVPEFYLRQGWTEVHRTDLGHGATRLTFEKAL
ncbi:GNAT family N-acetyltransferase [Pontivivens insulae]|uniref:Acetyltransferase n=1 Tax=Pontivivens insulae TaxID=1639689 RepID=A0A2R8AEA9_9RHOB|nr:GNAT family N-acetyltransferase [Pontivivens insulae]RED11807.1 N-acetylglutamate synthase-like GNAT family acetyltransferase [Pontivivens insulae]SPF30564.1 Acetyltransferase [Pontivivens insulae]